MTTEHLEAVGLDDEYIQWGVPGVPYSAVRVRLTEDAKDVAARIDRGMKASMYVARKYAEAFPNAPREESRVANSARPAQPSRGGYQQREAVVYVDGEPCCGMHKTRDGGPRPMRDFGDNFKCTAKKKDGSYCTNAVAKD